MKITCFAALFDQRARKSRKSVAPGRSPPTVHPVVGVAVHSTVLLVVAPAVGLVAALAVRPTVLLTVPPVVRPMVGPTAGTAVLPTVP